VQPRLIIQEKKRRNENICFLVRKIFRGLKNQRVISKIIRIVWFVKNEGKKFLFSFAGSSTI